MENYRLLSDDEILTLEDNGCTAEDWTNVNVAEDFRPDCIRNVSFCGEINLGVFEKSIEVSEGFSMHSGIRNATLRNVTVGDNCLIENIGRFISNYQIGDECYISGAYTIETTGGATFGEGESISVLNEDGPGNIILFSGLTSNLAALMVRNAKDAEFTAAMKTLIRDDISRRYSDCGVIGDGVTIVNTGEITDTHVSSGCIINGASRIVNCTVAAEPGDIVYIGTGVICDSSIITDGSSVLDGAMLRHCFVGEACHVESGFTADSSLFFANSHLCNGEACAAFCGPFSASHHKSTLLIGCMTSFYNAGSATNFSNHAYKMGPLHYGTLARGTKTASGSHILLPAEIGAFSVCLGKITSHPDTRRLPFSFLIADGDDTFIVPGRNLMTVGLYRDVAKWQRRDTRLDGSKKSVVCFDWLNPETAGDILRGKQVLERLRDGASDGTETFVLGRCKIRRTALEKGIRLYDMALQMFIGDALRQCHDSSEALPAAEKEWADVSGMLIPVADERDIIYKVKSRQVESMSSLMALLSDNARLYRPRMCAFTLQLITDLYGKEQLSASGRAELIRRGDTARAVWLGLIKDDARKEYALGDVDKSVLDKFLARIDDELAALHATA